MFGHFWSFQNQNKKKSRITAELYSSQLIKLTNKWHIYSFRKCVWRIIHQMVKGRDKIKTLEKATQIEKKSRTCFDVFFKFLWPFQKSWTLHIFLWFPWCLKKPWCNLRYRFLWITSKCRGVSEAFQTTYFLQLESN